MIPYTAQKTIFLWLTGIFLLSCGDAPKKNTEVTEPKAVNKTPPHIVFVTGDEEYRSEESMPMLARLAQRELQAKVTVCYALDSTGIIDPNRSDHIEGLEALKTADLMVMFTRFRNLPETQRNLISDYVESGRPIMGFRTATHAFLYEDDADLQYWNNEWPTKVFGQQWITHHGHFDDGDAPLTKVSPLEEPHPVLNGVAPFEAYSWLYHVDGGDWELYGDAKPLMEGRSLRSKHQMNNKLDKFPLTNPVTWTKSYTGAKGKKSRVFFTTLGHPFDFKLEPMRKLSLNGIYWALGLEDAIPEAGTNVALDRPYEPNNSGFGMKYKPNQRPKPIE
ncbi:ThuA domain-containing protein [Maribacter sp. 2307ULW6-5]|uniref:ThuA domain-containing protein n=1 Tax=Maribacter sp. 2307ULW6-5 TaxID=3386275 RepID=UPI0039BCFA4F